MTNASRVCSIDGCDKSVAGRGWCAKHYRRWCRQGSPHQCRTPPGTLLDWLTVNAAHKGNGCLKWPFATSGAGYGVVTYEGRQTSAQHVMCILTHGARPGPTHQAAHSCGKGAEGCVNPQHLRWATPRENMADQVIHGTKARGTRQGGAKLTEEQIAFIRSTANVVSAKEIAAQYGVGHTHVRRIRRGERWAWLGEEQGAA